MLPSTVGIYLYGFIKNSIFIGEYCRIVSDVFNLTKQKKITTCLLVIGMEKAVDTITMDFQF